MALGPTAPPGAPAASAVGRNPGCVWAKPVKRARNRAPCHVWSSQDLYTSQNRAHRHPLQTHVGRQMPTLQYTSPNRAQDDPTRNDPARQVSGRAGGIASAKPDASTAEFPPRTPGPSPLPPLDATFRLGVEIENRPQVDEAAQPFEASEDGAPTGVVPPTSLTGFYRIARREAPEARGRAGIGRPMGRPMDALSIADIGRGTCAGAPASNGPDAEAGIILSVAEVSMAEASMAEAAGRAAVISRMAPPRSRPLQRKRETRSRPSSLTPAAAPRRRRPAYRHPPAPSATERTP